MALRVLINAITDVAGVTVGHRTLIRGEGVLVVGEGPVRTGVTAILPRGKNYDPVFAGWYALNGNTVHAIPHERLKEAMKKYNRG